MSTPSLQIRGLRKRFGDVEAVRGLDLEVHSGEIFGLIGPDGAGKTTTMRAACGLLEVDGGEVCVVGHDALREPRRIKSRIGYMPQRFSLYPDLSVAENLRFFADLYRVPARERVAREARLLEFSRLTEFRQRRAGQLSGGMKQKLALACTLIHTPDLLVLDEPTAGVDPVSRQEFWNILSDLARDGKAVLVSTPYMDEAIQCDRVALMHQGRIIAQGTPEEVRARFDRRLLEISGDLKSAGRVLASNPLPGITANRFGNRIHVVFADEAQERQVREQLAGQRVEIREVAPGIEDTFVLLVESGATPA